MIAPRARRAQRVKSYERERARVRKPVNAHKCPFKETPVGVEHVRCAITRIQVRPCAGKVQVGLSNHSLKVGNG